jgi:hypothetical protein
MAGMSRKAAGWPTFHTAAPDQTLARDSFGRGRPDGDFRFGFAANLPLDKMPRFRQKTGANIAENLRMWWAIDASR